MLWWRINYRYEQADIYHHLEEPYAGAAQVEGSGGVLSAGVADQGRVPSTATPSQAPIINWTSCPRSNGKWVQARDYLLQAGEILASYNDDYSVDIALHNLALLWRESGDTSLSGMVAEKLGASVEETENGLRKMLENDDSNA